MDSRKGGTCYCFYCNCYKEKLTHCYFKEVFSGNVSAILNKPVICLSGHHQNKNTTWLHWYTNESLFSPSLYVIVIFGSSPGCCCHSHWLLLLLSRGKEFTHHGLLQEHGATGQFAGLRGFSLKYFCIQVHSTLNLTMYWQNAHNLFNLQEFYLCLCILSCPTE